MTAPDSGNLCLGSEPRFRVCVLEELDQHTNIDVWPQTINGTHICSPHSLSTWTEKKGSKKRGFTLDYIQAGRHRRSTIYPHNAKRKYQNSQFFVLVRTSALNRESIYRLARQVKHLIKKLNTPVCRIVGKNTIPQFERIICLGVGHSFHMYLCMLPPTL